MKNDESLRKNVLAEMKKNILELMGDSQKIDQMEQKIQNLFLKLRYQNHFPAKYPSSLRLY